MAAPHLRRFGPDRRTFLSRCTAGAAGMFLVGCRQWPGRRPSACDRAEVMTVRGPLPASQLGPTLPHEHLLTDFVGADQTHPGRWDDDDVVAVMLPYLRALRRRGFTGFADCTPAYLGRDVAVLRRLADAADMHILTNTGYYGAAGRKFLPAHARSETAEQLAARWLAEWDRGIDGTDIRPGLIKIGIEPIPDGHTALHEWDAKLIRAAARVCRRSGLTVACHCTQGRAAQAMLDLVAEEDMDPAGLIVVHADAEPDSRFDLQVVQRGAWLEFDGLPHRPIDHYLGRLEALHGYRDQVLLSMDAGWYTAGEPHGGEIRPYTYLADAFLPALRAAGYDEPTVQRLIVTNPARAFTLAGPHA